jgi:hypothetical protein
MPRLQNLPSELLGEIGMYVSDDSDLSRYRLSLGRNNFDNTTFGFQVNRYRKMNQQERNARLLKYLKRSLGRRMTHKEQFKVEALTKAGARITNAKDASKYGHMESVREFDPTIENLCKAIRFDHFPVITYMIDKLGPKINDAKGQSALREAIYSKNVEAVKYLTEKMDPKSIHRTFMGDTVLHMAARAGNKEIYRHLKSLMEPRTHLIRNTKEMTAADYMKELELHGLN